MQQVLLETPNFKWIDIVEPTATELQQVAQQFKLRSRFIRDSMDPKHLPKFEREENTSFVIIRHYDTEAKRRANSTTSLTRKIAIIVSPTFLLTIHRKAQIFFPRVAERFKMQEDLAELSSEKVALFLIQTAMQTFEPQIELMEDELERLEEGIFETETHSNQLTEIHRIIRRLSVFKRILIHSATVFQKWSAFSAQPLKEMKELNDHMVFFSDELLEDGRSLLQLHLSLASHRSGEIMRVLTLFSVLFMPLTFIVGIYGMNFKVMPELEWAYGYYAVLAIMGIVTSAIVYWFYKRGWLSQR